MIDSLFATRKAEEPVTLGELSVSERIARDFGFLGAVDESDAAFDMREAVAHESKTVTVDVTEMPSIVAKQMPIVDAGETVHVVAIETNAVEAAIAALPVSAGADDEVRQFETEAAALASFSSDAVVWMNTATSTLHEKGSRWYGATKHGAYVRRPEAEGARQLVLN